MRTSPAPFRRRSLRPLVAAALAAMATLAAPAGAQEWARKMFNTRDHDFGVVARGSDTVYKFEVKNLYKEEVVLGSVRSSCGCTTPSLENQRIKTFEKAYVVAKFNTRTFTGLHSATLTVDVVEPYRAQVQLRVHGNIRGDVVFEPGSIDFARVDQGDEREQTLRVSYAGRSGWRVEDVRSAASHLQAELIERDRQVTRVNYDLLVRLTNAAPAGYLSQQLVLVTNDAANPRIPIPVSAEVRPAVTVAPQNVVFDATPRGDSASKRVLVRAKRPFVVTDVACEDGCFAFEYGDTPSDKQLVTVRFTADRKPGRLRAPIVIRTDLGATYTATAQAYANVTESSSAAEDATPVEGERTASAP